MITSSSLGANGRLGNQLFQYAALKSLSLAKGYEIRIPNPETRSWDGQTCLLNNFSISSKFLTNEDIPKITCTYREPSPMHFDAAFFSIPDGTNLHGYFQFTQYFMDNEEAVKKELTPKTIFLEQAKEFLSKYDKPVVSVHVRKGDNDNGNSIDMFQQDGYFLGYLKEAIRKFPGCEFLVFSGGAKGPNENEEDIRWCRDNLGITASYSEQASVMDDFSRIMLCDHNILSQSSSFGWWAAYQNPSKDKVVIAPNKYHHDTPDYTHRLGFYPESFTIL